MDETRSKIQTLRAKAEQARHTLRMVSDAQTRANIESYIVDLEAQAAALELAVSTLSPGAMSTKPAEPQTGPDAIASMKEAVPPADETPSKDQA